MSKTTRIPHDKLTKWFRIELETRATALGDDVFHPLADIANEFGVSIDTAEDVLRGMEGVTLLPADQVIGRGQADFPRTPRKGENKGYLPGVKLETAAEAKARQTRDRMMGSARDLLHAAVVRLGLTVNAKLELEPANGAADVVSAILLATEVGQ